MIKSEDHLLLVQQRMKDIKGPGAQVMIWSFHGIF